MLLRNSSLFKFLRIAFTSQHQARLSGRIESEVDPLPPRALSGGVFIAGERWAVAVLEHQDCNVLRPAS